MAAIVLDTDVASGLIKKSLPKSLDAKLIGHELVTTFVSAGELERWTVQRDLGAPAQGGDQPLDRRPASDRRS